jgi:hypothetical protein
MRTEPPVFPPDVPPPVLPLLPLSLLLPPQAATPKPVSAVNVATARTLPTLLICRDLPITFVARSAPACGKKLLLSIA